jgi:lysylphosphatidylglycerol synthetase-like protein (DUF2156 family)
LFQERTEREEKNMFIDKAIVILGIAVGVAWVVANFIVAFNYSLKTMVEDFWKEQTIMGKICANTFYSLAWVFLALATTIVVLLTWVLFPIYKGFKWFVIKFLHPLYHKAIKFEL